MQHRSQLWITIIACGILIVLAALLLVRQSGGGSPRILVDQQRIDYGEVRIGESRAFKIKVTNSGTGVLQFNEKPYIEILEGC
jgi:hypothetical protein